eukprot:750669-Rhodomonas_salina.1
MGEFCGLFLERSRRPETSFLCECFVRKGSGHGAHAAVACRSARRVEPPRVTSSIGPGPCMSVPEIAKRKSGAILGPGCSVVGNARAESAQWRCRILYFRYLYGLL